MTEQPDLPDELLERVFRAIHEHLCKRNVMQYLDNEEDCAGIARAVAPMLIAHGRELEKAEVAKRFDHIRSDLNNISRAIEDEGDRCYFGSTNDPDELRRVACDFEDWLLREERNEHKSNEHRRKP